MKSSAQPWLSLSRREAGDVTRFEVECDARGFDSAFECSAFTRSDTGAWFRAFPSDAPHLERAWDNFQRLLPPWLRQMAGLEPVPWSSALEVVCTRLATRSVDWWLTGSAALAVRGVAVRPRDLDLVVAGEHARVRGRLG